MGIALKDQRKFDESINAFNKAITLNPNRLKHTNMGNTFQELGKFDDSIKVYLKNAISLILIIQKHIKTTVYHFYSLVGSRKDLKNMNGDIKPEEDSLIVIFHSLNGMVKQV